MYIMNNLLVIQFDLFLGVVLIVLFVCYLFYTLGVEPCCARRYSNRQTICQTKKLAKYGIIIFGTLSLLPFLHYAHDILSVLPHIPLQFYDMPNKTARPQWSGCKKCYEEKCMVAVGWLAYIMRPVDVHHGTSL